MERKEFILQDDDSERRLDRVLKRLLPNRTAAQIYSALRKGLVKVNGKKTSENYITKKGDVLSVAEFLLEQETVSSRSEQAAGESLNTKTTSQTKTHRGDTPCSLLTAHCSLQKIFENENLLLINKPAGISVHGKGSLAEIVAEQSKNDSLSFRAGPLHRLDKETTGLLAFSQSLAGAKWFSANIKNHAIKKYYLGIVCGRLEKTQTWNDAIEEKEAITIATPLAIGTGDIKGSKNNWGLERRATLLRRAGNIETFPVTLVEFQILTGRKHQIRIHSAAHGHAFLGDTKHGGKRFDRANATSGAFFLHAYKMEFPQNDLGLPPVLKAPLPKDFEDFLKENFRKLPHGFAHD